MGMLRCMNTLNSSLYAVAIMSCLLCSFVVRHSGAKPAGQLVYLGAYLLLESLGFVFEWLMLHPTSPGKSLWLGSLMSASFLLGPCLWLYAREITEGQRPAVGSLPSRHVAVIVAGMLLTLPLIQRAHLGPDYADPANVVSPQYSLFIHSTMLLSIVLFLWQTFWYLRACTRMLASHTQLPRPLLARIEQPACDTLRILILVLGTNWFVGLLRTLHCLVLGKDTGLGTLFAFMQVAVTVWAIFALVRRSPLIAPANLPVTANGEEIAPARESGKYAKSSLDLTARNRIQRKLHEAMAQRRLHCDNQLNLRTLCQHIRENPHYVSQVINQDLATTFHDLVNRHRIEDAKAALVAAPDKSVLDISLETGFNSKSTFNTAFRQYTGMTPSAYRQHRLTTH